MGFPAGSVRPGFGVVLSRTAVSCYSMMTSTERNKAWPRILRSANGTCPSSEPRAGNKLFDEEAKGVQPTGDDKALIYFLRTERKAVREGQNGTEDGPGSSAEA